MKIIFTYTCIFVVTFADDFPFRDISLSWEQRVDDLVSRLTLEEIVLQLSNGGRSPGNGPAPPIERLGILPWSWNTECMNTVAFNGPATSFPQSIGLSATFNRKLIYEVAETIAKEVRAKYNNNTAHGRYGNAMGINCFSPVVNVMRHPLWGRNQETYGEDPYLIGEISKNYVNGLQGNHLRYIRASATCKHFAAYNGPEDKPISRDNFEAEISERDWWLTYLPQFHSCIVEGKSLSVMCSYNKLNGIPACAHRQLLTDILRNKWNFTGFVVSDQDALQNIIEEQKWLSTYEEAAAAALLAGVNLGLSSSNAKNVFSYLPIALKSQMVEMSDIVNAVKPLFYTRMRLGEFDAPKLNPYSSYHLSIVQSDEHRKIAAKAAAQSFVLLKNKNNLLPLDPSIYNDIVILGPFADNITDLMGNFPADSNPQFEQTPLKGLASLARNVHFTSGCYDGVLCVNYDQEKVKMLLQSAKHQIIIICLGTGNAIEDGKNDRISLSLPGQQNKLLEDVISFSDNVPIILVLFNAGPVNSDLFDSADAILECFFPGQETGIALKNILLNQGPHSNPAGRLPYTWLKSLDQIPEITNYSMLNFTYRYWNNRPVRYPFGYGLSYTKFQYSDLHVENPYLHAGDDVIFSVDIKNIGNFDGEEVVQAYISWLSSPQPMPNIQLVGFDRIFIQTGESYTWKCVIKAQQLAIYFDDKGFEIVPGKIELYVGGQQPKQTVNVGSNVLSYILTVLKPSPIEDAEGCLADGNVINDCSASAPHN